MTKKVEGKVKGRKDNKNSSEKRQITHESIILITDLSKATMKGRKQ